MRGTRIIWGVMIVLLGLLGCSRTQVEADGASCLEPPWSVASTCENPRHFSVVLPGTTPADDAASQKFLDAHTAEIHALDGVVGSGLGVCCGTTDWDDHCISLSIQLCRQRAEDLITLFKVFQASSPETRDLSFKLSFELLGSLGPRCEPGPTCTAAPYNPTSGATPPSTRNVVRVPPPIASDEPGPICTHDGECEPIGSGNECGHWTESGIAGADIGFTPIEDAFCGCVEQRCEWFK